MKKVLVGLAALALVVASVPMFAAFEAHVINVTATIENALSVEPAEIQFGTVFPEEVLNKPLTVALSGSFLTEPRVDDITYVIRQKPKCGLPIAGTNPVEYSAFGVVTEKPVLTGGTATEYECVDKDKGYVMLPLLCPFLSKHPDNTPLVGTTGLGNDGSLNAFHGPLTNWTLQDTLVFQVNGLLTKQGLDTTDTWNIDLQVPCFKGHCAQDNVIPPAYQADPADESKIFGCDLWVEVNGVSLPNILCNEKVDLMLVLDRSGSIAGDMPILKTAAKAFVDILAPSTGGNLVGEDSFADTGTLDIGLSDNGAAVKAQIDLLASSGFTNLLDGITIASTQLSSSRALVPDFMVIITDGQPNRPNGNQALDEAAALAAATAAKAAGVKIFVVGVGSQVNPVYLQQISSGPTYYFAAADYTQLETKLHEIAECNN